MIEFYKDGDDMSILTDAIDEGTFIHEVSEVLAGLVEDGTFDSDWDFQLGNWLPCIVDICCKYRGYKNSVAERRVLCAGASGFPNTAKICTLRGKDLKIYWSRRDHYDPTISIDDPDWRQPVTPEECSVFEVWRAEQARAKQKPYTEKTE